MRVPKRPIAAPSVIPGTTLRRTYRRPAPAEPIELGDIVAYDGHSWDVAGLDYPLPPEGSYLPTRLMLERVKREEGKRKHVSRIFVDSRLVTLVGHQVLLPGMPAEAGPEAQR